ncbi:hypothetical protein H4I96_07263 [Botrytis cinerea]
MTKDASSSSTNISTEQNGSRETNDNNTVEAMASAVADGRRKSAPALCPTDDDTAKTVVAPLDRVKILFQASNPQFAKYTGSWFGYITAMRDIHSDEGLRGLFRGHSATILRIFPYAAIKFLAYEQIRAAIIPKHEYETPFRRLISGSLAGVTSVFFTYPLEVIRVRLAFETKGRSAGLGEICRRIYHEVPPQPKLSTTNGAGSLVAGAENAMQSIVPKSGLANFYRGFSATILGMLPYAGMSFFDA